MREILLLFLLILIIATGYIVYRRYRLGFYGVFLLCCVGMVVWLLCGSLINLNTLPKDVREKLDAVEEVCGNAYIRQDGNSILIKLNNVWVDLDKVSLVGDFAKDVYLEYEGNRIFVGHSGIYNTLKTLKSVGLIEFK